MDKFEMFENERKNINEGLTIGVLWTAEDIINRAIEIGCDNCLSLFDAAKVLTSIKDAYDPAHGINMDVVDNHILFLNPGSESDPIDVTSQVDGTNEFTTKMNSIFTSLHIQIRDKVKCVESLNAILKNDKSLSDRMGKMFPINEVFFYANQITTREKAGIWLAKYGCVGFNKIYPVQLNDPTMPDSRRNTWVFGIKKYKPGYTTKIVLAETS